MPGIFLTKHFLKFQEGTQVQKPGIPSEKFIFPGLTGPKQHDRLPTNVYTNKHSGDGRGNDVEF